MSACTSSLGTETSSLSVETSLSSNDTVRMPDVTGKTYDEASTILYVLNLFYISTEKEDGSSPWIFVDENWLVLSQDPKPGTVVDITQEIVLVVKNTVDARIDEELSQNAALRDELDRLKGESYITANEKMIQLGLTAKWLHSTSKQDYTETVQLSIASPDPEFDVPWIIVGYTDLNIDKKTVTLLINSQENLDSIAASEGLESALTARLDPFDAWMAVRDFGESEYPFGFKLHYIAGRLAQTPQDENTWFLKATCDVTNAFGAKTKGLVCEAMVTGTTDNPVVIYFIVY